MASNPISVLAVVCLLTFLHYTAAQMRGPVLPLYAVDHGATATGVGLILGAHMIVAAVGSIVSIVTSLLLPLAEDPLALMAIYGLAGLGVAAFTPSALSLVGDARRGLGWDGSLRAARSSEGMRGDSDSMRTTRYQAALYCDAWRWLPTSFSGLRERG